MKNNMKNTKIDNVGSFTWFVKMNEEKDEEFQESEFAEKTEGQVTIDTINKIIQNLSTEYPEDEEGNISVMNFTKDEITLTVPFDNGFYGETIKYNIGDDLEELIPKLIKKIKKKIELMSDNKDR